MTGAIDDENLFKALTTTSVHLLKISLLFLFIESYFFYILV